MTAPNAAPAETPSRPGSAKGLRVTPCSTAPDNPNAAPTSSASTARGRRSCVMISVARLGSRDHSPCHTSATGSQTRPAISETAAADTSNSKMTPLISQALVIERSTPPVLYLVEFVTRAGDEVNARVFIADDLDDVVVERVLHPRIQIEVPRHMIASEEVQPGIARGIEFAGIIQAMIGHVEVRADVELRLGPGEPYIAHVSRSLDHECPPDRGLVDIGIGPGVVGVQGQMRGDLVR